ncbi:hypothetical protein D3C75_568880 [compost metagenome]
MHTRHSASGQVTQASGVIFSLSASSLFTWDTTLSIRAVLEMPNSFSVLFIFASAQTLSILAWISEMMS